MICYAYLPFLDLCKTIFTIYKCVYVKALPETTLWIRSIQSSFLSFFLPWVKSYYYQKQTDAGFSMHVIFWISDFARLCFCVSVMETERQIKAPMQCPFTCLPNTCDIQCCHWVCQSSHYTAAGRSKFRQIRFRGVFEDALVDSKIHSESHWSQRSQTKHFMLWHLSWWSALQIRRPGVGSRGSSVTPSEWGAVCRAWYRTWMIS